MQLAIEAEITSRRRRCGVKPLPRLHQTRIHSVKPTRKYRIGKRTHFYRADIAGDATSWPQIATLFERIELAPDGRCGIEKCAIRRG